MSEFKWGITKYLSRNTDLTKIGNGILNYIQNAKDSVWPKTIGWEIPEADAGDIWVKIHRILVSAGTRSIQDSFTGVVERFDAEKIRLMKPSESIITIMLKITFIIKGKIV